MKKVIILFLLIFLPFFSFSQNENSYPKPTNAADRMASMKKKLENKKTSLFKNIRIRNIGPTIMSGRVTDIDVSIKNPNEFYVAFASGGLWKTSSNGTNYTPLFEQEHNMTIGDIAVDWEHGEIIWLGSGENNSSRSSYAGTGIYKSIDKGRSWQWMGLGDTHHISRIILHPTDINILWVAAIGHLYSPNKERGVFKSIDGGKNWEKVLFINENTGAIDLVIDPKNPSIIYASMWERERKSWNFMGSGASSGIYKSIDGGENWQKKSGGKTGFPEGKGVGRIGLAISATQTNTLYALLDNQERREEKTKEKEGLTKKSFEEMEIARFLKLENEDINKFLDKNNFPKKYNAVKLKKKAKNGTFKPKMLSDFLQTANQQLFDTPVKGAEVYRSDDGGNSWKKTHKKYIDDTFYSYGYYFGQIRVAGYDVNQLFILGVPLLKSMDGGKTFSSMNNENVHADHHALFVNPKIPHHIIAGNDGGINISYDQGETWFKTNNIPVGQFYDIHIDDAKPYHIYGGLQDNGVWYGAKTYKKNMRWQDTGKYPYQKVMGGDGMQTMVDTRNNKIIFTGYQFGNYFRIDKNTGERKKITPTHNLGEHPFRFNWQTPIHLSKHNQDILYLGSHKFHRSLDGGNTFTTLSDDLTKGNKTGNVPYNTLTTIEESPLQFGLIYVGTDDGYIHVSDNMGESWKRISDSLPQNFWISRIKASNFKKERLYVALNGYRWDHLEALIYVSENRGGSWKQIGKTLPLEPINAIQEDTENENILYVGTDNGLYISLDRGETFEFGSQKLPNVAVHDLELHKKDKELIIGTHGRSLFITSIKELQKMNEKLLEETIHLFEIDTLQEDPLARAPWSKWEKVEQPQVSLIFYSSQQQDVSMNVSTENGTIIIKENMKADRGINYFDCPLEINEQTAKKIEKEGGEKTKSAKYYLPQGVYIISLKAGKIIKKQQWVIKYVKKSLR